MRGDSRWMRHAAGGLSLALLVGVAVVQFQRATAREAGAKSPVPMLVDAVEANSGLCVHLGFRDAGLTTELTDDGRLLVHGLSPDAAAVAKAREAIRAKELEGLVSVEQASLEQLPYADHLVNLVVVEDLPHAAEQGLSLDEVLRVLSPGGVAFLGVAGQDEQVRSLLSEAGIETFEMVEQEGAWAKVLKSRPEGMDVWSHRRYDASGTAVSQEELTGVPTGVRWVAGPTWASGLRYSAVQGVTASERQLVYFFDDEIQTPDGPQQQFSLVARDAYNGLPLWKRRVSDSRPSASLLVTVGDRVYTILDDDNPLVALDAANGETVQMYEEAGRPSEVLVHDDALIVRTGSREVRCLDAADGRLRWANDDAGSNLLVGDGRVFFQTSGRLPDGERQDLIGCLDLETGEEQWQASTKDWPSRIRNLVFYREGVIVVGGRSGTHAVSAEDGSHLWTYEYPRIGHGGSYSKVLYQQGLVWVHPAESDGKEQYAWEGLDPQTGEIKRRLMQPEDFRLTHRCFEDRATASHILCGTMDFVDFETGEYRHFAAARHSCRDGGVMPANGLLYTFPHSCHCYPMLRGFLGLASKEAVEEVEAPEQRLETGPAFGAVAGAAVAGEDGGGQDQWPTFRGDARRRGSTAAAGPERLEHVWEQNDSSPFLEQGGLHPLSGRMTPAGEWGYKTGGRLSSPVAVGDLVLVASTDAHRIDAVDSETGKVRWSHTAGGRVDCPPTISGDLCLFGSRDGWVYCLRAADGELVWRFRAAPTPERILAFGQLESVWPVVGGVLVRDGLAYFTAGRHSHGDGGIHVYAAEPDTGKIVWHAQPDGFRGVADMLVGEADAVHMISWQFDPQTGENRDSRSSDYVRAGRLGLASDEWYSRPRALRKRGQQWSVANEVGQTLVLDDKTLCGFNAGDISSREFNRGEGPIEGPATLFAKPLDDADESERSWSLELPQGSQVMGMVLAGQRLFVAGRLNGTDLDSHAVRIYSVQDGSIIDEHSLSAPPVYEGLAVAGERLYVSIEDGRLLCLGTR